MMCFFDTHVHFDLLEEAGCSAADIVGRAVGAKVGRMLAVGGSPRGNESALAVAGAFPRNVIAAVGYDRDCAGLNCSVEALDGAIRGSGSGKRPAAIGEIGLDFHYHPDTAEAQTELFVRQLELAGKHRLPVVVHSREADDATAELLKRHVSDWGGTGGRVGVLHCFTGDIGFAARVLDMGFHVSFSGIATFRNAAGLRAAAVFVPSDRLLIETDSPYLAPVPYRGKRNEPAFLPRVADVLAEARSCSVAELAEITTQNAEALFGPPAASGAQGEMSVGGPAALPTRALSVQCAAQFADK